MLKYLKTYKLYRLYKTMPSRNNQVKKTPRNTKSTKAAAPVVTPEPVAAPAPTPAATEQTTQAVSTNDEYAAELKTLREDFAAMEKMFRAVRSRVNTLERLHNRSVKQNSKVTAKVLKNRRKKERDPNAPRAESGISRPTQISSELAKFLNEDVNNKVARTDVIKRIAAYVKEHNLENPENRRQIKPDAALQKLLKVTQKDEVTYFNLQRYLKSHFPQQTGSKK